MASRGPASPGEATRPGPLRVVVVGNAPAGPQSRGGMASVVRLMALEAGSDPHVDLAVVATFRDVPRARQALGYAQALVRLTRLLAADRVDVLHVHLSHGGSVVRKAPPLWLARRRGVPTVLHLHSFNFGGWFDALRPAARRLTRRVLQSDAVVALSPSQATLYRSRLDLAGARLAVVPNPASLPMDTGPRAVDPTGLLRVVFLGRYGERKGVSDLLAALARLTPAERDRVRLVTAGDGGIDQVRADVAALGLQDCVEVRGWVDPAERDALLAGADVFALPSYDEALPMALIEAMAFRVVPVVTPVGGLPDLVRDGDNGLLVDVGDPDGIAEALRGLLADPARRLRIGERARASVEVLDAGGWWHTLTAIWTDLAAARR